MTPSVDESTTDEARPYTYTDRDFERVRKLIHQRAGIALADGKRDMVYSRLSRRLRSLKKERFSDYLDMLERDGGDEWQAFTNALTTNLTAFFRESHHFDILKSHLVSHAHSTTPMKIWCSAASTGEEPYSLAMTAVEAFDSLQPPVRILATDIDTQVLDHAQRGIYTMERIETLSPERRRRFFRRGVGANDGYCRVIDELRALISFRPFNLLDLRWPLQGPFSAVFCRNVMIYFDKPTQYQILQKMVPLMTSDSLFFAGHSESFFHAGDLVKPCGRTVYQRADTRAAAA